MVTTTARACFVTGATGFVALNVVDELLRSGWVVHALHRPGSKRAQLLLDLPACRTNNGASLKLVEGDVVETGNMADLVSPETEVIFHIVHVGESISNPDRKLTSAGFTPEGAEEHIRLNNEAMANVLAAAKQKGVRRVVYCSSWSSYGRQPNGTFVAEATASQAYEPVSAGLLCMGPRPSPVPYFISKFECENLLREAVRAGEVKEAVILQPCSIFGRYGDTGWCGIFNMLLESNGSMPGLPGSSSFVDAEDLAAVFVKAADLGPGAGEAYVLGGTNASSLEMQKQMGTLVGTSYPTSVMPAKVMQILSKWNESLLSHKAFHFLRVKPHQIATPWLVCKLTQDQSATSEKAQEVFGYRPRSLRDILRRNYDWLVESGALPTNESPSASGAEAPLVKND